MPMFPEVDSMMVVDGPMVPSRIPAASMPSAARSLMLPPGFEDSHLANKRTPSRAPNRWSSTSGVFPIAMRMFAIIATPHRRRPHREVPQRRHADPQRNGREALLSCLPDATLDDTSRSPG